MIRTLGMGAQLNWIGYLDVAATNYLNGYWTPPYECNGEVRIQLRYCIYQMKIRQVRTLQALY